jgi:tRNA (guanine37-N1)-methyltransferase
MGPVRFTVETLFPGLVGPWLDEALIGRARRRGLVDVVVNDLRRFAGTPSNRVDDAPYGGGAGMVIRVDVAAAAIDEARAQTPPPDEVVLLSPAGEPLTATDPWSASPRAATWCCCAGATRASTPASKRSSIARSRSATSC